MNDDITLALLNRRWLGLRSWFRIWIRCWSWIRVWLWRGFRCGFCLVENIAVIRRNSIIMLDGDGLNFTPGGDRERLIDIWPVPVDFCLNVEGATSLNVVGPRKCGSRIGTCGARCPILCVFRKPFSVIKPNTVIWSIRCVNACLAGRLCVLSLHVHMRSDVDGLLDR